MIFRLTHVKLTGNYDNENLFSMNRLGIKNELKKLFLQIYKNINNSIIINFKADNLFF